MHVAINGWFAGQVTAGSGQYIDHLLWHLPRQAPDVRWSLLAPAPQAANLRRQTFAPNVEIVQLPLAPLGKRLAKLWWEQVTVAAAARRLGAGVLWVPYWAAPWWQPRPVVVTVHDLIPVLLPAYRGGWAQRLYTALVARSARRAHAVLTVSEASARDIVEHLGIPRARVHVVHHGPNQPQPREASPAELAGARARYGLPERYFLYLGGFDVRKNVRGILLAYRRYLDRGGDPAIGLVIAGQLPLRDTPFAPDPQRTAAELNLHDQVRFCGWVAEEDKPALYALATAYLFPSLYEGFGMMLLEAMQAGAPVITSGQGT